MLSLFVYKGINFMGAKKKTHEDFVNEMKIVNSNIEIIGIYTDSKTTIKCRCKIDGYEWDGFPTNLLRGNGCAVCANKAIMEGVNDIPTTAPWMIPYFQGGYEEAKKYSCQSHQKIYPICPECGKLKNKPVIIKNIYRTHSIGCICSDGVSYPNKFAYAFLSQLPISSLELEFSPDWIKPKKFDCYFEYENKKYILEMDGGVGHGNRKFKSNDKDVAGLMVDMEKDILAKENNIEVIRIDCLQSEKDYIKNNILNNKTLFNVIGDNVIDWDYCDLYAHKNILKEVCEYWNNAEYTTQELAKIFKKDRHTISQYLKKGSKFGFCKYDLYLKIIPNNACSIPFICNDKYAFCSKSAFIKHSKDVLNFNIPDCYVFSKINKDCIYNDVKFKFITIKEFFEYYLKHPELSFY